MKVSRVEAQRWFRQAQADLEVVKVLKSANFRLSLHPRFKYLPTYLVTFPQHHRQTAPEIFKAQG